MSWLPILLEFAVLSASPVAARKASHQAGGLGVLGGLCGSRAQADRSLAPRIQSARHGKDRRRDRVHRRRCSIPAAQSLFEQQLARVSANPDPEAIRYLNSRTKKGYFWAIARDDRPWGGTDPPAVAYSYAPGRGAVNALKRLEHCRGIVQCERYSSYKSVADAACGEAITLAFCWAHLRRRFFDTPRTAPLRSPASTEACFFPGASPRRLLQIAVSNPKCNGQHRRHGGVSGGGKGRGQGL